MSQAIKLLSKLVAIPSPSGQEEAASRFFASALPAIGWERVEIDESGSVIAGRGTGERELVLMGHIDTVPGGPPHLLERDVLWGRGSVDAKGPLCAFAVTGGRVPLEPNWRITLIAATGEEADSRGALFNIPKHHPAACLIGEPSGADGVTIGYRGCLRLLLSAEDGGAHRSGDSGPLTAVVRTGSDMLAFIEEADDPNLPIIRRASGAVASMLGQENGHRRAKMELDIRIPEGDTPHEWFLIMKEKAVARNVELKMTFATPPHVVDKNNPAAWALRLAIRKNALSPRILAKGGTADFNLAAAWDCPMAAYGPGDSKLDHTAEERLSLSEYQDSLKVLSDALPLIMQNAPRQG
ncbi:MAG: M20/M25/M40 family metallo-hydrolase [Fretibacterium sp.]|nr:M20/M25/M40 family metallo-hydrolase [Fretibacterium sp.]